MTNPAIAPGTFDENTVNMGPALLTIVINIGDFNGALDGATITLSGLLPEDRISVRDEGTGIGQIGFDGTTVDFGGTPVGSVTGGVGTALTITLNASATAAALAALVDNLTYANISDTPNATRTLSLSISEPGGTSVTEPIVVTVCEENDVPTAMDDVVATDDDLPFGGDVLVDNGNGADRDPDGDALTVTAVNGQSANVGTQIALTSGALLTLNADGSFDYDPNGAFDGLATGAIGADSFAYTVADGQIAPIPALLFPSSLAVSALDGTNGFRIDGIAQDDRSGIAVSFAGDVNGDGTDDLIIGASGANSQTGESYVVFGSSSGLGASVSLTSLDGTDGFRLSGADFGDETGTSVSRAGDVNGDGIDDLIIGAIGGDTFASSAGESYVVFGTDSGFAANLSLATLDGTDGFLIHGVDASGLSGASVSAAGDVNGDGVDDLIIGAPQADVGGTADAGKSYVVFGTNAGFGATLSVGSLNGVNGFSIGGLAASDLSGFSVSSAGDLNDDGIDDLVVGAQGANSNAGASYVLFGSSTGFATDFLLSTLTGSNGFQIDGLDTGDQSGYSVSAAGDINDDGIDDLVIGARGANGGAGETYVVFGTSAAFAANLSLSALDGTNGFRLDGVAAGEASGSSVSSAGDVNGDGIDDLIIGAPGTAPSGSYVVFGSDRGFASSMALSTLDGTNGFWISDAAGANEIGSAVSGGGDVNGDGFDDLIIGAPGVYATAPDAGATYVIFGRATFGPVIDTATVTVNVTGINDAPTAQLPASVSAVEDTAGLIDLSALIVSDDDGPGTVTVTLDANSGTLAATSTVNVAVVGGGTGQLTLTGAIGDVNAFLQSNPSPIGYTGAADNQGAAADVITVTVGDGQDTAIIGTIAVDISSVIDPHVLSDLVTEITFAENTIAAAPALIDADVSFRDVEGAVANGSLIVTGMLSEDTIGLRDPGTPAGFALSGNDVTFGGTAFGTVSGGGPGGDLTVLFNANATAEMVEALVENLTFGVTSDAPNAVRDLVINVFDAAGTDLGLGIAPVFASFEEVSGAGSPFDGVAFGFPSSPFSVAAVDVTNDSVLDIVIGDYNGTFRVLRNDGGSFTELVGTESPMTGVSVDTNGSGEGEAVASVTSFGDLLIGNIDGALQSYRNYVAAGYENGLYSVFQNYESLFFPGVDFGIGVAPALIDLNRLYATNTLVVGSMDGGLRAFHNVPSFVDANEYVELTGAANPFDGIDVGSKPVPIFADLDGDGDKDLIVADNNGNNPQFFENENDVFTRVTGDRDPFSPFYTSDRSGIYAGTFADFDGDGQLEAVFATGADLTYYENVTPSGLSIRVNVTPENDPAAGSGLPLSQTVIEETIAALDLTGLVIADPDITDIVTVTFTAQSGQLDLSPATTLAASLAGILSGLPSGPTLSFTGTSSELTQFLQNHSIFYQGALNVQGPGADQVSVAVDDGTGVVSIGVLQLDITNVNDAPTMSGLPTSTRVVTSALTEIDLSTIQFSDVDDDTGITVTVTASAGTLSASATVPAGLSVVGDGTGTLTLTGTATEIDNFLKSTGGLEYTDAAGLTGTDVAQLTFAADDGAGSGVIGLGQISLNAVPPNVEPVLSGLPPTHEAVEDQGAALNLTGISLTDGNAADQISLTLTTQFGTLSATSAAPVTVAGAGTRELILTGTAAQLDAFLTVSEAVTYLGAQDAFGALSDTVVFVADDSWGPVTLGSIGVNIAAVDDPLQLTTGPARLEATEDTLSYLDLSALSLADVEAGQTNTVTLTVDAGTLTGAGPDGLVIQGTASELSALFDTPTLVGYTGPQDSFGSGAATLTLTFTAPSGEVTLTQIPIDIANVNDPLSAQGIPTSVTVTEDVATGLDLTGIQIIDNDPGDVVTLYLSVGSGSLIATGGAGVGVTQTQPDALELTGSAAALTAYLAGSSVSYLTDPDASGDDIGTLSVSGHDSASGVPVPLGSVSIDATPVNDAPTVEAVPTSPTAVEETASQISLSGLVIGDVDPDDTLSILLSASTGSLTAVAGTGVVVSGNASGAPVLTGKLGDLNAYFATGTLFSYTGDTDVSGTGADTITVTVSDAGPGQGIDSFTIDITNVNDAPRLAGLPTDIAVTEAQASALDLSTVVLSDDDGPEPITVFLEVDTGVLTLGAASALSVTGAGTMRLSVSGTRAEVQTFLTAPNQLLYTGDADVFGQDAAVLNIEARDGAMPAPALLGQINLDIAGDDRATALTGLPAQLAVVEDTPTSLELTGLTLSDPNLEQVVSVTLGVTAGQLTASPVPGVAITGSGTSALILTGTAAAIDTYLNTADSIAYLGAQDAAGNGAATLTVTAPFGAQTLTLGSAALNIAPVNDAPTASGLPGRESVTEDAASNLDLSGLLLTHVDQGTAFDVVLTATAGVLTATGTADVQVAGTGTGQLTLTGTAPQLVAYLVDTTAIRYTTAQDAEGTAVASVTISYVDGALSGDFGTVLIDSTNVNDGGTLLDLAPVVSFAENTVNTTPQLIDSDVRFTDPDHLAGAGSLIVSGLLPEDVVSVLDGLGAPNAFSLSGSTLRYDGIAIGTVSGGTGSDFTVTFDPSAQRQFLIDRLVESLTYANTSDAPTATRTLSIDILDDAGARLVNATSADGLDFTVQVTPENDPTSATGLPASVTVAEDQSSPIDLSAAAILDPDAGDQIDLVLSVGAGTLTAAAQTGVAVGGSGTASVTLTGSAAGLSAYLASSASLLTYLGAPEAKGPAAASLNLTADDGSGVRYLGTIAIDITPENDAPTLTGLPTSLDVVEETATPLDLRGITFSDIDSASIRLDLQVGSGTLNASAEAGLTIGGNASASVTITGTPSAISAYVATLGNLTYTGGTNITGPAVASLTVSAHDAGQDVPLGSVDLNVINVNDAPVLTGVPGTLTVTESAVTAGPVALAASASFTDAEGNLNGGSLRVSGVLPEDTIAIADTGTGPGEIGIDGANVTYGGTPFATVSGGHGAALVVNFGSGTTSASVEALIQSLTYENPSDAPTTIRHLHITVTDAAGAPLAPSANTQATLTDGAPFDGIQVTGQSRPVSVDFDGDGDLDLVLGTSDGRLRVFDNNDGDLGFTELTGGDNPFAAISLSGVLSPAFADLDGDLDLDLVIGGDDGALATYLQTNAGFELATGAADPFDGFVVPNVFQTGNSAYSAPSFADIDDDGDLDLIVGEEYGSFAVLENNDADFGFSLMGVAENPLRDLNGRFRSASVFTDVDGDGDIDALVGGYDGTLLTYLNPGDGGYFIAVDRSQDPYGLVGGGYYSGAALLDLDDDLDLDVVVGTTLGQLQVYDNPDLNGHVLQVTVTAEDDAPVVVGLPTEVTVDEGITGDLDLSTITITDPDTTGLIFVTLLASSGTLTAGLAPGVQVQGSGGGQIGIAGTAAAIDTYLNDPANIRYTSASGVFGDDAATVTVAVSSTLPVFTPVGAVSVNVTHVNEAPVLTGVVSALGFDEATVNATPQLLDAQVTLTDLEDDFDGGTLIVSGLLPEDIVAVRDQGVGVGISVTAGGVVSYLGTAIGTATGGAGTDLEIALGANADATAVRALIQNLTYANQSDTPTASRTLEVNLTDSEGARQNGLAEYRYVDMAGADPAQQIQVQSFAVPSFFDLTGDSVDDLIVGYVTNTPFGQFPALIGFPNFGGQFVQAFGTAYTGAPVAGATGLTFYDLDGDTDLDAVVGVFDGSVVALENTAGNFAAFAAGADPLPGLSTPSGFSAPALVDLDGDTDLDVVIGGLDGTLTSYENNGGSYTLLTGSADPFDGVDVGGFARPAFADLDGDGDQDAVVGSTDGGLRVFFNDNGTFVEAVGIDNPLNGINVGGNSAPIFADVAGDATPELVVGALDGTVTTFQRVRDAGPQITISVSAINDAPAISGLSADLVAVEATPSSLDLSGIVISDPDAPGSITVTMSVDTGSLTAGGAGGVSVIGSNSGTLTLTGTPAAITALLTVPSAVVFTGPDGLYGDNAVELTISGNDGVTLAVLGTSQIDVTDVVETQTGDSGDESLTGTSGADIIDAFGGNDTVIGLDGPDTLTAGSGSDTLVGGGGDDALFGSTNAGEVNTAGYDDPLSQVFVTRRNDGSYEVATATEGTDILTDIQMLQFDQDGTPATHAIDSVLNTAPALAAPAPVFMTAGGRMTGFVAAATDAQGHEVTYTLNGPNADLFEVDPATGVLSFFVPASYADFQTNMQGAPYIVEITASDGYLATSQNVSVAVLPVGSSTGAVQTDAGNALPWQDHTEVFDATNMRTGFTRIYDDGRVLVMEYDNDVRSRSIMTDAASLHPWSTIVTAFDATGALSQTTWTYDNGRVAVLDYTNGLRTRLEVTDVADVFAWHQQITLFDPATQQKTEKTVIMDDGRVSVTDFVNGDRSQTVVTDANDQFAWSTQTKVYDNATGEIDAATTLYDDGRIQTIDYVNGARVSKTITDVDNAHVWSTQTTIFDTSTGTIDDVTTNYDDGRVQVVDYVGGIRSSIIIDDVGDTTVWDRQTILLDPTTQNRTKTTVEFDNGQVAVTNYLAGTRTDTTIDDTDDAFVWTTQTTRFEAGTGAIDDITTVFDDGRVRVQDYDAGQLTQANVTDVDDVLIWANQSITYDPGTGQISTLTTVFDSGAVFTATYDGGIRVSGVLTDAEDDHPWDTKVYSYDAGGDLLGLVTNPDPF